MHLNIVYLWFYICIEASATTNIYEFSTLWTLHWLPVHWETRQTYFRWLVDDHLSKVPSSNCSTSSTKHEMIIINIQDLRSHGFMWNIVTHPAKNGLLRIRFNVSNLQSLLHYSHLDQSLPYLFRTHLALDIFGLMTNIFPNQDNPPISRAETMLLYHASVWKRGRRVKHSDYSYMLSRIHRIYLQILDDSPQIHANTSCVFQHHAIDYSVIFNAWYSNPPDYSAQYLN
eukprot:329185_1